MAATIGPLTKAFDSTVKAAATKPEDAALISSGRTIALQIDDAVLHRTPIEITKALYLVPHLINVLRELKATPAAREPGAVSGVKRTRVRPAKVVNDDDSDEGADEAKPAIRTTVRRPS